MTPNAGTAKFTLANIGIVQIDPEGVKLIDPARVEAPFIKFWKEELSGIYTEKDSEHIVVREMVGLFEQELETKATNIKITNEGPIGQPASGGIH